MPAPVGVRAAALKRDRPYLLVLRGPHPGELFGLGAGETLVGRSGRCEVQLCGEGVSRHHARLFHEASGPWVEDLQSTNGTFVNGTRTAREALFDGDRLRLGEGTLLKFT